jgi:hypothetical protein
MSTDIERFEDLVDQLGRYSHAPAPIVLKVLEQLATINDDLKHDRPVDRLAVHRAIDGLKALL